MEKERDSERHIDKKAKGKRERDAEMERRQMGGQTDRQRSKV